LKIENHTENLKEGSTLLKEVHFLMEFNLQSVDFYLLALVYTYICKNDLSAANK